MIHVISKLKNSMGINVHVAGIILMKAKWMVSCAAVVQISCIEYKLNKKSRSFLLFFNYSENIVEMCYDDKDFMILFGIYNKC